MQSNELPFIYRHLALCAERRCFLPEDELSPIFLLHIEQLVDLGDHISFGVLYQYLKLGLDFGLNIGAGADFGDLVLAQMESGLHYAFTRLPEANAGRFVPDDVAGAKNVGQHEHVKRIDHGVKRAAEMGADVIAVIKTQGHLDFDIAKVMGDAGYANGRAEVGRVKLEQAMQLTSCPVVAG